MDFLIVTSSYRRPELLQRNIQAMVDQSYTKWLHIIVDDCSNSESIERVLATAEASEKTIVLRNTENKGCNYSRNKALDYIQKNHLLGYMVLVDDDDYLLPDALEKVHQLQVAKNKPIAWLSTDCTYPSGVKSSNVKHYGEYDYLNDYFLGKKIKGDLTHFIDVASIGNARFPSMFRNGQEWFFFCQLAKKLKPTVVDLDVKIVQYLEDGLSKTKANQKNRLLVMQEKIGMLKTMVPANVLAGQQLLLFRELVKANELEKARQLLVPLLKYRWYSLKLYRYWAKLLLLRRL